MSTKGTLSLLTVLAALAATAADYSIRGTTDKDVAIYKAGEKMEFTFRVFDGETPIAGKKLQWTRTGDDGKTEKGEAVAGCEGVVVTTSMDKPGFVRYEVKAFGEDGKNLQGYVGGWGANKSGNIFFDGGACVEPEKLTAVEEPKDFDDFWNAAKAKLASMPITAQTKEVEGKKK